LKRLSEVIWKSVSDGCLHLDSKCYWGSIYSVILIKLFFTKEGSNVNCRCIHRLFDHENDGLFWIY
jgi:hypothetical protein